MEKNIVIATRGSGLAIKQSEIVKALLISQFPGIKVSFLEVVTHGDVDRETPLSAFGNTGVFVKSLEEKLLSGEADLAVHSLKDVPSVSHPDLQLAAFPVREDVRDVLVTRDGGNWRSLKTGVVVGTSSPARTEQMKLLRPDLIFSPIRGNVETRVKKVLDGEYYATILAAAGLNRLGYKTGKSAYFTLDEMIPSPGQGALAIQVNRNRTEIVELVGTLNNPAIELLVKAERAFMAVIGGGCRFPVAACAQYEGKSITFRGMAYKPGFKNIETVKFETTENGLFEKAVQEAKKIILKNETNMFAEKHKYQ